MKKTSGVEDDIENGFNGFYADIGDVDKLVRYIKYIDGNKGILYEMGQRSMDMIVQRNKTIDDDSFWKEVLNRGI